MRFWRRLKWWHLGVAVVVVMAVWSASLRTHVALLRDELSVLSNAFCDEDGECTAKADKDVSGVPFGELNRKLVGWVPDVFVPKLFPAESSLKLQPGSQVTMTWEADAERGKILTGGITMRGSAKLTVVLVAALPCPDDGDPLGPGEVRKWSQVLSGGASTDPDVRSHNSTNLAVAPGGRTVLTMTCEGQGPCDVTLGAGSYDAPGGAECERVE